ncbi:MAG: CocE/NonD family hydrolase [Bryobacteraceae bacterium]
MSRYWLLLLFSSVILSESLFAADDFDIPAHYTKYEHQIPMRDGKRLWTAVYLPKDGSEKYPILITRTPYSVAPYGLSAYPKTLGPSLKFARDKFIFAYQDVRGRFMSEGQWLEMTPAKDVKTGQNDVDESSDTYDTIEWLIKNVPNNNGKVGLFGTSYPGFYTSAGMIDAHPALVAASPQAPVADLYMGDDAFHNGAFFLIANFSFYKFFGKQNNPQRPKHEMSFDYGTKDGYPFYLDTGSLVNADEKYFKYQNPYWTDIIKHPNYDAFWKTRNILPHLKSIKPAVLVVGGWFDAEDLSGTLKTYRTIQKQSPGTLDKLVMGPWVHGGWERAKGDKLGDISFGSNTADFFRDEIEYAFFRHYLKGAEDPKLPQAYVFETGKNRWQRKDQWPPSDAAPHRFYLRAHRELNEHPPAETSAFDEYVSDPNNPIPFFAKPTLEMTREYMEADQRFVQSRPDVLSYETEPLTQDMTIAGSITPSLFVSTSGTDSDYVVKLIDVYPDNSGGALSGYEELVRGEPFRGKFRKSFEKPEPFRPGEIERIHFTMPDVYHCFQKGHRIMVQVQSSWFPLVDRNPQTFVNIPTAKANDFQKATERIYRSSSAASFIEVNVEPIAPAASN